MDVMEFLMIQPSLGPDIGLGELTVYGYVIFARQSRDEAPICWSNAYMGFLTRTWLLVRNFLLLRSLAFFRIRDPTLCIYLGR